MRIEKYVSGNTVLYPRIGESQLAYQDPKDIQTSELPTGRVSVDDTVSLSNLVREFSADFNITSSKFPLDYLDVMQNLSLVNPDVSQMIDNIVQLGNTGHKVIIETKSEADKDRMLVELNNWVHSAFRKFGGPDGFVNSVLAQVARGGAGSVEWIVNSDVSGLEKVAFVPIKTVRFILDPESGDYLPHQKVSDLGIAEGGLIPLNENTYQYCALQLLDNSPYAVPPILSALESIMIQRDIIKNFKFVAKKLGLLGFVTFLLKAPQRKGGETDTAYVSRLQTYLAEQAEVIKYNYRDGIAVGFQDNLTVEHHSLMESANGATEIMKEIEQQVFSGLKSDPALHGRTYSTTETYAGVVYEKMLSILTNYQRTVRQILEYGYKLHLVLAGFTYDDLYVEFEASKSLSDERDETTYNMKLQNLELLYNQGIISQERFAQEAGYDAADQESPRDPFFGAGGPASDTQNQNRYIIQFNRKSGKYESLAPKRKSEQQVALLTSGPDTESVEDLECDDIFEGLWVEYLKEYNCGCGTKKSKSGKESLLDNSAAGRRLKLFMRQYFRKVFPSIKSSRIDAVNAIDRILDDIDLTTADSELFAKTLYNGVVREFGDSLQNTPIAEQVRKQINFVYTFYRLRDAEPFGGDFPVKPSFNLVDRNAIKFMRSSDNFYFGRYLTDPKTKKSLQSWLADDFLKSGRSLRDPGEMKAFRSRFGTRVAKEDFKVLRVVETSVSRAKNWGNVLAADQAEATKIEIAGPKDNLTCPWCSGMIGKTFSVKPVVQNVKSVIERDPEDLPQLSPFLPGRVHPQALPDISEEQLLAQGIALPPYHPHCRHRFVVTGFE